MKKWENLPDYMRTEEVRPYYDRLRKKRLSLVLKRGFDFLAASFMLLLLSPVIIGTSIIIAADSKGGVFFKQERVTQYGRRFRIFKFRTMVANAESLASQVTTNHDMRITKIGKTLRKYRLDEIPQLINIITGDMSFVGTRPEVPRFVNEYTAEMFATLLLPAGLTSQASIKYKDEARLLETSENVDEAYIHKVLPEKMRYNLESVKQFSLFKEFWTMIETVIAVIR